MNTVDVYLEWDNPVLSFLYKDIVLYRSNTIIDQENLPNPVTTLSKGTSRYTDKDVPLNKIPYYSVGCRLYNDEVIISDNIKVEYIVKIENNEPIGSGEDIDFKVFGFGNKNNKNVDFDISTLISDTLLPDDLVNSTIIFTFIGNIANGSVTIKEDPISNGGVSPVLLSRNNQTVRTRNAIEFNIRPFSHRFTNAGSTGRNGPSLTQCRNAYSGEDWVDDENQFTVENGIQIWTVPVSGYYRITAVGAQGGRGSRTGIGGMGAKMSGVFWLDRNQEIEILVGQQGFGGSSNEIGGGGGSFVVNRNATNDDDILVIAGGGGGYGVGSSTSNQAVAHATTARNGKDAVGGRTRGTGGRDGNGGNAATSRGAGGGGFYTNGQNSSRNGGGLAYLNGGLGGVGNSGPGGFGGGGATDQSTGWGAAAGGGGYSGGGGAYSSSNNNVAAGGGGGSINNGTDQDNQSGFNTGHGYVEIERVII